jgi:hypothetical protein
VAEPGLIDEYCAVLRGALPAALAEEVGEGLVEAYEACLRQGMAQTEAARTAVAEFGDPEAIVAEFTRISPARRAAATFLLTGPLAGACWAALLITGKGWDWPVPLVARVLVGGLLLASIAGLITATRTKCYGAIRRSGVSGCLGLATVDASMIMAAILVSPRPAWLAAAAIAVSAARITCVARSLRPMLA